MRLSIHDPQIPAVPPRYRRRRAVGAGATAGPEPVMAVLADRCSVFERVVCGFDSSPSSLDAVWQAATLRLGSIELAGVFEPPLVGYLPYAAPEFVSDVRRKHDLMLVSAHRICPEATLSLLPDGPTARRLLERAEYADATLVAVGASGIDRWAGIVRGSLATAMLHRASASVLVARSPISDAHFPRLILVGYDGSTFAAAALEAGRDLVSRFCCDLRVVIAGEASRVVGDELAGLEIECDSRDPVHVLRDASREADLLLVGARGLRGIRAIGSVSERIGHQALCSVLVVKSDHPSA
jgi:nucleotide-binding universal stress UspA family protein